MRTSILILIFLAQFGGHAVAGEPNSKAAKAWERYLGLTEHRVEAQQRDIQNFLHPAAASADQRATLGARLKGGEVVVEKLTTTDDGKQIETPGALIHHWMGTAFIEKSTIKQAFAVLQDYDHHSTTYAPEVQRSKLIHRSGDDFTAYLRFVKRKVITVVLDTYHQAHYGMLDATHAYSRSFTTQVTEIEDPGKPTEREKCVAEEEGFMWKMNTYWRFEERDGGLYIQCEAITLTRDVPFGLAWMVEPFVASIPKESLTSTMVETRTALADSTRLASGH